MSSNDLLPAIRRCPPFFPSHWAQFSSRFVPSSHRAADYVKESGLPPFLNERTLEVQTPSGKQILPNPFLGYTIDRCGGWVAVAGKSGCCWSGRTYSSGLKYRMGLLTVCAQCAVPCANLAAIAAPPLPRSSIPFPPYDSCKNFMSMLLPNTTNLGCTTSRDDWDRINEQVETGSSAA